MAQITRITSEALQATVRRLLPSQQGFGEDLEASNVITPIIDLTPTAEGSAFRQDLQTSFAFNDLTHVDATNTTVTVSNTPGFYRVIGAVAMQSDSGTGPNAIIQLSNGLTTKNLWFLQLRANTQLTSISEVVDLNVYLNQGESIVATSSSVLAQFTVSARQIADVNGNLVNPSGFSPQ